MALPIHTIEHFVRLFLGQWHYGLEPYLSMKTECNGAISVNFNVATILNRPLIQDHSSPSKSGRGSRSRRRKRRSQSSNIAQVQQQDTGTINGHEEAESNGIFEVYAQLPVN